MPLITCRDLGQIGRVGNQLFLYVFAKAYAEHHGCELRTADWFGRKLFVNATERLADDENLPQTELDSVATKPLGYFFGQTDIDVKVFGQHQCYLNYYTREQVRRWLELKPKWERYALPAGSSAYSAAHLRRGDYVTDPWLRQHYCEVSEESYDFAAREFHIPTPIIKVFEGWRPVDPTLEEKGLGWLPDFLLLRDAAYLLRGNSSFSVWASWLGHGRTYSPLVGNRTGLQDVRFTEGNHANTAGVFRNQSDLFLKEK